MKKISVLFLVVFSLIPFRTLAQFTPGRVVVLRCAATSASGNDGSLVEYLPSVENQSVPTYSVALPNSGTTDSGSSIVFGQNSAFNHVLSLSADGALVVIPGYGNKLPSGTIDSATGANRVVATVRYDGVYARPINSAPIGATAAFRSAASDGFGNFWGNPSGQGFYFNINSNSVALAGGTLRAMAIANGNISFSTGTEVRSYPGFPTTFQPGSSAVIANHSSSATGFSIPSNPVIGSRAYLADVGTTPGVQRYDWDGGAWVWQYTLAVPVGTAQHIAVDYSGANPVIFVTTAATTAANRLYAFTDTNALAVPLLLATNASGVVFRGVVLAPTQPASPTFTVHPSDTVGSYGSTVTFGPVDAANANPNGYSWKKGTVALADGSTGTGSTISGATTPTLTIANISPADASNYFAVASNNGGSTTSSGAVLTLAGSSITTQLVSRTNVAGTTATFHVVSGGPAPLTYAWSLNNNPLIDGITGTGSEISGSASATLTVANVQDGDEGSYTVTVTDGGSAQSSSTATLTVVHPPQITAQPANQNKNAGATANFTVQATGGALSYQWFKGVNALTNGPTTSGSIISGVLTTNLSIAGVQDGDAGSYSVTVTNLAGSQPSDSATLSVGHAPIITLALINSYNYPGSNGTFTVAASGTETLTYVWRHNGTIITDDGSHIFGATTPTLSIVGVGFADTRAYSVTVSNDYGSATSSAALFVKTAPPQPNTVPGLIVYEPFNYPTNSYPAVGAYDWDGVVSTYNQQTGEPAYWYRVGGLNSAVQNVDLRTNHRNGGTYPWPGIECNSTNTWYWSSAPNNNHFKFGGVTNGSVYFSCVFHVDQGSALNQGGFDIIAGFTSGNSTNGGANVDTWNYKLCTQADGAAGDGYLLGVFKGDGTVINSSSQNGQWAPQHLLRGQIHFVVGCYKINSGGINTNDDVVSLWIDPPRSSFGALEANVPTPDAGGMVTNWFANAPITEFALKGTVPPASKRMADLRIGQTWASVTQPYYPALQMASTPADVTLSWPAKDSDYILQSSIDLGSGWLNINPPYALDPSGTTNTATVSKGSIEFFRLKSPY